MGPTIDRDVLRTCGAQIPLSPLVQSDGLEEPRTGAMIVQT